MQSLIITNNPNDPYSYYLTVTCDVDDEGRGLSKIFIKEDASAYEICQTIKILIDNSKRYNWVYTCYLCDNVVRELREIEGMFDVHKGIDEILQNSFDFNLSHFTQEIISQHNIDNFNQYVIDETSKLNKIVNRIHNIN